MKYGLWTGEKERLYPIATRYEPGKERIKKAVWLMVWAVVWVSVWWKMGALFCAEFDQITNAVLTVGR